MQGDVETNNQPRAAFEAEVAARFGLVPNFFRSAEDAPDTVRELWAFAKSAYLDSPLPALFKERLFVHLSRFCEQRYCVVRHCGFLVGKGRPAGDATVAVQTIEQAVALLRQPILEGTELNAALARLESLDAPVSVPDSGSSLERDVFTAASVMFLQPARCGRAREALRAALGGRTLELLTAYLAFIRTAHYWTLTHPELEAEEDVEELLRGHEELARLLLDDSEASRCEMGQRLFDELVLLRKERDDREELRRAKRELEERDRQKDEFIAMLGHELRNPLATIRAVAQTLALLAVDDPRLRTASGRLDRQTALMARMIADLLDVSRLGRGKISLEPVALDLAAVVRDVALEREQRITAAGLELHVEQAPGAVRLPVRGDRGRLVQTIENLLDNAVKFTAAPGRITVRLRRENANAASVDVEDNGIGFDSQTRDVMFQPFAQARQELDRKQGGLGLGLAIGRMIAQLHGGSLSGTSAGPGLGATFTLTLPLDSARVGQPDSVAGINPQAFGERRTRVLLVEDNRELGDSLAELLGMMGCDVTLAYDGPSALDRARRAQPQLVLCDLGLPGMDGFQLALELRRDAALPSARLIALSGYGRPTDHRRAAAAGFEELVVKPIDIEKIRQILVDTQSADRQSG